MNTVVGGAQLIPHVATTDCIQREAWIVAEQIPALFTWMRSYVNVHWVDDGTNTSNVKPIPVLFKCLDKADSNGDGFYLDFPIFG